MLPFERYGTRGPKLVLLHWLTGSACAWKGVAQVLASRGLQCVAINLPGFGDASNVSGFDVRAMARAVIETVQSLREAKSDDPWFLGGHSMGGKLAAVVARAAADGEDGLQGLRGALLVSPSTPSPEPMEESNRKQVYEQLGEASGGAEEDRKRAKKFIENNVGKLMLREDALESAVRDVLRMNRTALRAWMSAGSKEDWSSGVGKMPIPALILAGSEEPALGPDVQRAKTMPHFSSGAVVELKGCGHLAPLERPFEVAEHFCSFLSELGVPLRAETDRLGASFSSLLESARVSPQTRAVMETRLSMSADWNAAPTFFTAEQFRTMRALAECVVPGAGFDVAASVEERLGTGEGDGWRFASLPPDAEAWRKGLTSLDAAALKEFGVQFVALHGNLQRELLERAMTGNLGKGLLGTLHVGDATNAYSADEMKQWFEEVRGEFAKCYMAHPTTMERVHYTGFADDAGFTQIQIGQREVFED